MLSKNASVNEGDEEGWTLLHKAVANGYEDVVKMLMTAGADPEMAHNSGLNAIKMAYQKNQTQILKILMKA